MRNTRRANKLTRTSRWKLFSAKRLLTPNLLVHTKPIHWMAQWKRPLRIKSKKKLTHRILGGSARVSYILQTCPTASSVAIFVPNYKRLCSKMLGTFMQGHTDSS